MSRGLRFWIWYQIMILWYILTYTWYIYHHIRYCKLKLCYLELDLCVASANRDDICWHMTFIWYIFRNIYLMYKKESLLFWSLIYVLRQPPPLRATRPGFLPWLSLSRHLTTRTHLCWWWWWWWRWPRWRRWRWWWWWGQQRWWFLGMQSAQPAGASG